MGTDKRDRQKANRAAKIEAERAAADRAKRMAGIKRAVILAVIVVVALLAFSALTGCGSESSDGAASSDSTTTAAEFTGDGTPPEDATSAPVSEDCATAPGGKRTISFAEAPTFELADGTTYTATFETSEGTVAVALDTERTPETTANFIALANACFYDGTQLFRTEAQTGIIQGGSPTTNDGGDPGPGYTIADEGGPFTTDDYAPGTLSMARTSAPDSAGAQFFFLSNEGGRYLGDASAIGPSAGSYVVFGQTTEGLDVLQAISSLEVAPGAGVPSTPVTIESVRISEG
jgi:peptidyl-prolyl cis-trans isomerase B (cyclophilin B)